MSRVVAFWLVLLLLFVGSMFIWLGYKFAVAGSSRPQNAVGAAEEPMEEPVLQPKLAEFSLLDQTGERFHSTDMQGKVWIGSFFFASCPSTCFAQNVKIQQLQAEYADRGLKIVSITCDPSNDTPAALAAYAGRFNADYRHWRFLTGDIREIEQIGAEYFLLPVREGTHSDRVVVFDRQGEIRGAYSVLDATQFTQLRETIDQLLDEPADPPADEATAPAPQAEPVAETTPPVESTGSESADSEAADPQPADAEPVDAL